LVFPISFQYAAGKKVEFILEKITDKGCFADATPSIQRDEFALPALVVG
jgi:hypothetical protein